MKANQAGMCSRYLNCLVEGILTERGQRRLTSAFDRFKNPPGWAVLQNPVTHRGSYSFSEVGRMMLIAPFLLATLDPADDIKGSAYSILVNMAEVIGDASEISGLSQPIRVFVEFADHIILCMQKTLSRCDYQLLQQSSIAIRRNSQLIARSYEKVGSSDDDPDCELADSLGRLPNVHIGVHLAESARRYVSLGNISSTMGEERHKTSKRDVLHISTAYEPTRQLLVKANVAKCLELLALGLSTAQSLWVVLDNIDRNILFCSIKFGDWPFSIWLTSGSGDTAPENWVVSVLIQGCSWMSLRSAVCRSVPSGQSELHCPPGCTTWASTRFHSSYRSCNWPTEFRSSTGRSLCPSS